MSKKKTIIIIIVVVCVLCILGGVLGPLLRGVYIDLFVVEPYENTNWQDVDFFRKGYISVPSEWTYTSDDKEIIFYDSNNNIVLYAFEDNATIPSGFPEMNDCDRYRNFSSIASGVFDTASNFFSFISPEGNYYFGTYYRTKYGTQYFGSLVAYYDAIDEETFRNILNSHRD